MATPAWTADAIWYAVYPLGSTGAPLRPDGPPPLEHRLPQLVDWLDHLVGLGCNGLLLGPIFASRSHGYDTLDHFTIDPRLGDDADFDALVDACHQRGVRLVLDGVLNHVSAEFRHLETALADPDAPSADWFHIDYSTQPPTRLNFEGSDDLVVLNHKSPKVLQLMVDVLGYWLARGIDGWRLDAAYAVDPVAWQQVLSRVCDRYPQALFVGEVIHADQAALETSTLCSITAYELWKAVWGSISDANLFELDWTLQRHNELLETVRPLTFVGNHDVTRITTRVGPAGAVLALVVLCTVGGMPAIYYGDEGGVPGTKYERPGGDDEVRPAMPANPADWQPPEPWLVDVHRELIGLRRRHPWLVDARYEQVELANERMVYKVSAQGQWLQVTLEVGDAKRAVVTGDEGELYRFESA